MASFEGIAAVEAELEAMSGGPEPLVLRLPRRSGQKEERWTQLLAAGGFPDAGTVGDAGGDTDTDDVSDRERLSALADELAALRAEVVALRSAVEQLNAKPSP
jgi:uncharacterized protein YceH (UPF0502 family)